MSWLQDQVEQSKHQLGPERPYSYNLKAGWAHSVVTLHWIPCADIAEDPTSSSFCFCFRYCTNLGMQILQCSPNQGPRLSTNQCSCGLAKVCNLRSMLKISNLHWNDVTRLATGVFDAQTSSFCSRTLHCYSGPVMSIRMIMYDWHWDISRCC